MKKVGLGTTCVKLLDKLYEIKERQVSRMVIVETGTLRDAEHEAGWETEERSTLAIAQWINSKVGAVPKLMPEFYSIDSSEGNIRTSQHVIESAKLEDMVIYREGDSRTMLEQLHSQIDFALLDSDTDPNKILSEFDWVHKVSRWPSIVVVDDVFDKGDVNKGQLVLPQATRYRLPYLRIGHAAVIGLGAGAEEIVKKVAQELA